jgi:hypothetical protein
MAAVVEIRTYKLRPGSRDTFSGSAFVSIDNNGSPAVKPS